MIMKSKISRIFNQSLDTLIKIINISKFLDKKHLYKLLYLLISMIIGSLVELLFLISLSSFIRIVLNNGIITQENISDNLFNYFYFTLLGFFANFTESNIISNCMVFILVSIITLTIRLLTLRISFIETAKIGAFIETKCGESLMGVPYSYYKNLNISILLTDFNNIPKFVGNFIQSGIQSLSSLIIIISLTIYVKLRSDSIFIFAFILLAFIYIITLLININKLKSLSKKNKKLNNQKTSNVNFIVRMFRNILLEQKEYITTNKFSKVVSSIYQYNAQGLLISTFPKIIIEYSAIITISILLIIQAIIYGPAKSIESTGIFLVALLRILPSLQIIYVFLVKLVKSRFVIESVYDLLNLPCRSKDYLFHRNNIINQKKIKSISLKNISFKYSNANLNTINDLSFEFVTGKSYALIGSSGSGKSTLIDIILNLLSPQSGEIVLNNKDKLSNSSLDKNSYLIRSNTLLIGQSDFYCGDKIKDLLDMSIKDENNSEYINKLNIGKDILKINNIFEKNNINSFIGENGCKISGGQRQRILLLKAFLSKKNILIFDEATSSLDEATKNIVMEFLLNPEVLTNDRIMIFSTHSKLVANACDEILRM